MTTKHLVALAALAVATLVPTATSLARPDGLSSARAATHQYHDIGLAMDDGWGFKLYDKDGIACIDKGARRSSSRISAPVTSCGLAPPGFSLEQELVVEDFR